MGGAGNLLHPASRAPLLVRGPGLDVDLGLIHTLQDRQYLQWVDNKGSGSGSGSGVQLLREVDGALVQPPFLSGAF